MRHILESSFSKRARCMPMVGMQPKGPYTKSKCQVRRCMGEEINGFQLIRLMHVRLGMHSLSIYKKRLDRITIDVRLLDIT